MFFTLSKPVSKDFTVIASFAKEHKYPFIHNHHIFHRRQSLLIKALLFIPHHGIAVFDTLDWDPVELAHASAKPAETRQGKRKRPATIDVDETHKFIENKFNEILHHNGAPIVNFVLLNNISSAAYDKLDTSIKSLLPLERVIFNDDSMKTISQKLNDSLQFNSEIPAVKTLLSALFIDYVVSFSQHGDAIITSEQENILQTHLQSLTHIIGASGTGKSTILFNKLLHEKLCHPEKSMVLIAATQIACDIYKQMLLDAVEFAIVDIDFTTLFILTPEQFRARYGRSGFLSLSKDPIKKTSMLFCDDATYIDETFITYLHTFEKRFTLILALEQTNHDVCERFELTRHFRQESESEKRVTHGNLFMHTLLLLQKLLKQYASDEILIITPDLELTQSLQSEVKDFFGTLSTEMDADQTLINADFTKLIICEIDEIHHLERSAVIFIDSDTISDQYRDLAMHKAMKHLEIIQDPTLIEEPI